MGWHLCNRFPCLYHFKENLDQLEIEFLKYQLVGVPTNVHYNSDGSNKRIDCVWFVLEPDYPNLAKVMLTMLVIPHSNAVAEIIFSLVRKNYTDFRPNMGVHLLESTLVIKLDNLAKDTPCFKKLFSSSFIKEAKSCTAKALKSGNRDPGIDVLDHDYNMNNINVANMNLLEPR